MDIHPIKNISDVKTDLLCVTKFEGSRSFENQKKLEPALIKKTIKACEDYNFEAGLGEIQIIEGNARFRRVMLIGLGRKKSYTRDTARLLGFKMVKEADLKKIKTMSLIAPSRARELVEGIRYADYRFKGIHEKEDPAGQQSLSDIYVATSNQALKKHIRESEIIFDAVRLAKDLVNLPSNIVTPTYLEKQAKAIVKGNPSAKLEVLTEADAKKLEMGAFLAVAKGSKEPGKMITMEYRGAPTDKTVYGVIGKGITFDSGGISLKSMPGIMFMKIDMAGGAAALGVFKAVMELKLKVNLLVIIAATENMPGGNATRPGDVVIAANGKTIEIQNTDAEGRLVLADALVYAQKKGASKLIDIATLTGAAITTFGGIHTALMSNDQDWADAYLKTSQESGEKAWQLPIDSDYDELIKSDVADIANISKGGKAGSISGAKLLEKFIKPKNAWIHLDIAGTSYLDAPRGYHDKSATGVPIRTIVELLKQRANQ